MNGSATVLECILKERVMSKNGWTACHSMCHALQDLAQPLPLHIHDKEVVPRFLHPGIPGVPLVVVGLVSEDHLVRVKVILATWEERFL